MKGVERGMKRHVISITSSVVFTGCEIYIKGGLNFKTDICPLHFMGYSLCGMWGQGGTWKGYRGCN